MGGACSTYSGGDRRVQGFGEEILRKDTTWEPRRRWENNIDGSSGSEVCGYGMDRAGSG